MRLPEKRKFSRNFVGLSFAVPTGLMLIVMFITSVAPFGENTMLYSDMYHQYYPFFVEFRETLRSGDSLLWNWSVGLGMDYLGLISYYLGSPLNLLSVLVPDGWVLDYFSLLMPIKIGLASGFFAIMLKKLYDKEDLALTLFSSFYGMCAWALGYQWNIMWLDTFALLPLVMLGTVLLLRDKKYVLYTISLFLSIFANYYVGFFVCIFVFLFFFCYEICRFRGPWRFVCDLVRIGIFTVLAIGMTAILELPALAALQDTYSSVNKFPEGFVVNMVTGEGVQLAKEAWETFKAAKEAGSANVALWLDAFKTAMEAGEANVGHLENVIKAAMEAGETNLVLWWDALKASYPPVMEGMAQVAGQIGGGQTLTYIDGLPNLYCGVLPVALGFLFLLAKNIKLRDKFCCVFFLLLFMLSFIIRQLDYIWHGFHFTNQIPYRFSFLFSFVLIYMAYRAWLERENFHLWQILLGGALAAGIFLADKAKLTNSVYIVTNFAFLGLYLVAMCYGGFRLRAKQPAQETVMPEEPETLIIEEETAEPAAQVQEDSLQELVSCDIEEQPAKSWWDWIPDRTSRLRHSAALVAVLLVVELVLHVVNFTANFSIYNYDYPQGEEDAQSMFEYLREREAVLDFFRTEVTHSQTLNDGALNGYNGISTFSSSANVRTTEFMEALGYAGRNNWNRYCWEESSPVANLFLNLLYMVERSNTPAENSYFDVLHSYHDITLMKNNAYLPLGFLTEPELADVDFSATSDAFVLQNRMFRAATGLKSPVWSQIGGNDVVVTAGSGVKIKISNNAGYTSFKSYTQDTRLTYTYNIQDAGFMCLDLTLYANKKFSVWHNGLRLYTETYSLPMTMAVCDVKPGDTVEVIVECAAQTDSAVSIKGYLLNETVFWEGYDILAASTLQLTEFSNTYISGVIKCDRDGLLYTSVPQCGNKRVEAKIEEDGTVTKAGTSPQGSWAVYVDGVKVDNVLVGNCMIAVELTEGIHTVELRYENKAFEYGSIISFACAAVFGGIVLTDYLIKRKRKKA